MWESNAVLDYPTDKYILKSPAKQREPLLQFWGTESEIFFTKHPNKHHGKSQTFIGLSNAYFTSYYCFYFKCHRRAVSFLTLRKITGLA